MNDKCETCDRLRAELDAARSKLELYEMRETCSQCGKDWSPSLVEGGTCVFCINARLREELDAARKELRAALDQDWTASLIDRTNEFLREHPVTDQVKNGAECSNAISFLHGYCGGLKSKLDAAKADCAKWLRELENTNRDYMLKANENARLREALERIVKFPVYHNQFSAAYRMQDIAEDALKAGGAE